MVSSTIPIGKCAATELCIQILEDEQNVVGRKTTTHREVCAVMGLWVTFMMEKNVVALRTTTQDGMFVVMEL